MDKSAFKHVVIIVSFTGSIVQDLNHKDHIHNQAPPPAPPNKHMYTHNLSNTNTHKHTHFQMNLNC